MLSFHVSGCRVAGKLGRPFDRLVIRLLGNEGEIDKTFDEIVAQIRNLRRFFLLGAVWLAPRGRMKRGG